VLHVLQNSNFVLYADNTVIVALKELLLEKFDGYKLVRVADTAAEVHF